MSVQTWRTSNQRPFWGRKTLARPQSIRTPPGTASIVSRTNDNTQRPPGMKGHGKRCNRVNASNVFIRSKPVQFMAEANSKIVRERSESRNESQDSSRIPSIGPLVKAR